MASALRSYCSRRYASFVFGNCYLSVVYDLSCFFMILPSSSSVIDIVEWLAFLPRVFLMILTSRKRLGAFSVGKSVEDSRLLKRDYSSPNPQLLESIFKTSVRLFVLSIVELQRMDFRRLVEKLK